jgi:hypothetical protein
MVQQSLDMKDIECHVNVTHHFHREGLEYLLSIN